MLNIGELARLGQVSPRMLRPAWEALVRWIEDSGYRLVGDCREHYHEWHDEDPTRNVMELQQPIAR